ncbi:polyprenyl synthetase family protein [Ramlibacter sp. MMS24-I3-19]|uniref:polyprenyl synthetase family protein n=1 Tax=Ramlibacter sp. MMS24-I3-19 TaxID=3416606 RepID=UPI003D03B242
MQSRAQAWHARVDRRLAELLPPAADRQDVAAAMRDGVLAPGKRLRPLLMLATGRALGCDSPALLDAACAVEMVHAASLVLDDMPCMDDACLRRGRPTVHVRHGEDAAVLAVVALLAQACATVAALPGLDGSLRARVVCVLCDAVGPQGLVRGQFRDLREGASARTMHAIAEANDQKTGVLFACALEIAALVAGAPQAVASLRAAASEVGQAFQLKDDLEDGTSSAGPADKDRHQDTGKSTMVALLGRGAVEQRLQEHLARAEALVREVLPDSDALVDLLRRTFATSSADTTSRTGPAAAVAVLSAT